MRLLFNSGLAPWNGGVPWGTPLAPLEGAGYGTGGAIARNPGTGLVKTTRHWALEYPASGGLGGL